MHNPMVREQLVDAALPDVEVLGDMVQRAVMIASLSPTDAHYVISKLWEGFGSLVMALTTLGVDDQELGRELLERAQIGDERHRTVLAESPDAF